MIQSIKFCTGNPNKVKEVQSMFTNSLPGISIVQHKLPLVEIQAETLEQVALFKLQSIQNKITPPFLSKMLVFL